MVSSSHFSKTIFKILNNFKIFCEENNKWPLFSGIVTDFSFANIHAITKVCNGLDLTEYLTVCFQKLTSGIHQQQDSLNLKLLVKIFLCNAHLMKMLSNDLKVLFKNVHLEMILKDIFANGMVINDFEHFVIWFRHISVILTSETENDKCVESFNYLTALNYRAKDNFVCAF